MAEQRLVFDVFDVNYFQECSNKPVKVVFILLIQTLKLGLNLKFIPTSRIARIIVSLITSMHTRVKHFRVVYAFVKAKEYTDEAVYSLDKNENNLKMILRKNHCFSTNWNFLEKETQA